MDDYTRSTYTAFKRGARLRSEDVQSLLHSRGIVISNARLRELGRDSDRAASISSEQLYHLIAAWADKQRQAEP